MDSCEKRNVKMTNSRQFQMLIRLMQENVQLAKCVPAFGSAKFSIEEAWDDVARKVNGYGPPERSGYEWKKVWTDLKCRTKKKVWENHKIINTCGEGSSRLLYLSELEQSVDKILNLSTTVASQVLDESPNDFTIENDINDNSKQMESKILPEDAESNIHITSNLKAFPQKKIKSQIRLSGKRKYQKKDKHLKLLQQQIKSQEKILEAIQMQAANSKALADTASKQAKTMTLIAESTKSIALALQEAVKYFNTIASS